MGMNLVVMMSACNSNAVFDETRPLPQKSWEQNETMIFEVPIRDTLSAYKFYVNVRHSLDYRYSNLYLFIDTHFPDGRYARDTVECRLADPAGKWYGKGITNFRYNQILLRSYLRFPKAGIYRFELEQAMREKELEGIKEIGIRIEKE
jgi:gliding motility-associated lipoprotein GldH